jgi:Rab-GTPase-TBC domain
VYHIFFGGFQHLEGRRYYGQIDFKHIIQSADVEQDEDIMDENIKIMD